MKGQSICSVFLHHEAILSLSLSISPPLAMVPNIAALSKCLFNWVYTWLISSLHSTNYQVTWVTPSDSVVYSIDESLTNGKRLKITEHVLLSFILRAHWNKVLGSIWQLHRHWIGRHKTEGWNIARDDEGLNSSIGVKTRGNNYKRKWADKILMADGCAERKTDKRDREMVGRGDDSDERDPVWGDCVLTLRSHLRIWNSEDLGWYLKHHQFSKIVQIL